MRRFAVVATAGAGGDLPPLIAVAKGLGDRGHDVRFIGDASVANALRGVGGEADVLPPELDLGPRLTAALRAASDAPPEEAGAAIRAAVARWAVELWPAVSEILERVRPHALVTSLFGAAVAAEAATAGTTSASSATRPWRPPSAAWAARPTSSLPSSTWIRD